MPACTRGVTFPLKQIVENVLASPPFSKLESPLVDYVQYKAGNQEPVHLSEETESLLYNLIDLLEEQLRACDLSVSGTEKRAEVRGYGTDGTSGYGTDIQSIIGIYATRKLLSNKFEKTGFSFELSDKEYCLAFHDYTAEGRRPMGLSLKFVVDPETNSIKITRLAANDIKEALDFFDPRGNGYDFFTPDDLKGYKASYPTSESRKGRNMMSPELRGKVPSLLSTLKRRFRANQYPDQTEAFKAYEQRLRRDDQGGDTKRRRMEWAIGSSGYHFD